MILNINQKQISSNQLIAYADVNYKEEDKLFAFLKTNNFNDLALKNFTNKNRRIEWMSVRYLLHTLIDDFNDLTYNEHGKPILRSLPQYVSISHSKNRIAISIDKKSDTAIDLQFITPKIDRIKHKYLKQKEIQLIKSNLLELSLAWSVKEALFKIYGKNDIFLKANIHLHSLDFKNTNGKAIGQVIAPNFDHTYELNLDLIDDYVLAYVVNS